MKNELEILIEEFDAQVAKSEDKLVRWDAKIEELGTSPGREENRENAKEDALNVKKARDFVTENGIVRALYLDIFSGEIGTPRKITNLLLTAGKI